MKNELFFQLGCPYLNSVPYCIFYGSYAVGKCIGSLTGQPGEVPNITVALTSSSNTSIELHVNVLSTTFVSLACAAFSPTFTLSSVLQIAAKRSLVFYSTNSIDYAITGLSPYSNYDVYCYAKSSYLVSMSLADVLNTRIAMTTACCKTIAFSSVPQAVFDNEYSDQFVYTLSSAPSTSVTIIHSANDSRVRFFQPSNTFTSTSIVLRGSFLLRGPEGTYTITLTASGVSATEYVTNTTIVINIYLASIPLTAPVMTKALLSDDGGSAYILFNVATDLAGISTPTWNCSLLFSFDSSSTSTCVWLNTSAVLATFPAAALVQTSLPLIGSPISVISLIVELRAACQAGTDCLLNQPLVAQTITLSAPYHPITPTISLVAPSSLNADLDVVVDPTATIGSGGRSWDLVFFTVTANTVFNGTLFQETYLNPYNRLNLLDSSLVIPHGVLAPGYYEFHLTVTNFLAQTASSYVTIQILNTTFVPRVSILGPSSFTTTSTSTITLQSVVQSGSYDVNFPLIYTWTVYVNGTEYISPFTQSAVVSKSKDPKLFKSNMDLFEVSNTYTIVVMVSSNGHNSSAFVQVYVESSNLATSIIGGNEIFTNLILNDQ